MSGIDLAFPYNERNDDGTHFFAHDGLNKREYFAGLAMQATISELADSSFSPSSVANELGVAPDEYDWHVHWPQFVAKRALTYADALLAALDEPQP